MPRSALLARLPAVPPPSPATQVEFLAHVQRLLSEGQFTSSYKFALLHALADLAVERGGDDGDAPLVVSTQDLAEKFVAYYWRQAVPYVRPGDAAAQSRVLLQNSDGQAAIINKIAEARTSCPSMARLRRDNVGWGSLLRSVAATIRSMPLWKLQRVGDGFLDFLYENRGRGSTIELHPEAAYCLRRFHSLVVDLIQAAWLRFVRGLRDNQSALGQTQDLAEFMFGSERRDLGQFVPILTRVQEGRCFYCGDGLRGTGAVDHFVPWARYSVDLGHNFVIAHATCNGSKSDRIAALVHLERWWERNEKRGSELAEDFQAQGLVHDLTASRQVARWTYAQIELTQGLTWVRGEDLVPLDERWRQLLAG